MKEYIITFPRNARGLAYKGRDNVRQCGLYMSLREVTDSFGPQYSLVLRCVNSRGHVTNNFQFEVPSQSATLREIIKVLQEFKDDVDNSNDLSNWTFNEIVVKEA